MLNKQLCEAYQVDKLKVFFVDYIDEIDDQIDLETNEENKKLLLEEKERVNKIRHIYNLAQDRTSKK